MGMHVVGFAADIGFVRFYLPTKPGHPAIGQYLTDPVR